MIDKTGLPGHLKAALQHKGNPKPESKNLFQKILEENKQQYAKGSLPQFPQRFVRPKEINPTQAKRLAQYAPLIKNAAIQNNVPIELICGVILQESGGNPRARSHAGAKGLMQLMPGTARRFGVRNAYDPAQNIEGGTKYLRWLLDQFNGSVELALAGYNAGEGNVVKHGMRIPPFRETQEYVPNVLGYCVSMIDVLRQVTPSTMVAQATTKKST